MPVYITDTSVIVKWFNQVDEDRVELSQKIYDDMIDDRITLIAPNLLTIELINVLATGKKLPQQEIKSNINNLLSLPILIKTPTQATLERTIKIIHHFSLAAYDALFLALAQEENCQLISDDTKGHGKIKDGSVIMLKDYK